jgi:hypothetical protein
MKTSISRWASVAVIVVMLMSATIATTAAAGGLSTAEQGALTQAIDEEYKALNTYRAILVRFPDSAPFANIVYAEQQHVNALANLFGKYNIPLPGNPGTTLVPANNTFKAACQLGVDVELEDVHLYDKILPVVSAKADLTRVFSNLRSASLYNHLPAFDACN